MPDISMCENTTCPNRLTCHRFTAKPSERHQSYMNFSPDDSGKCLHYWQDDGVTLAKLQAVFYKVAAHLLMQGERSLDSQGSCAYRGVGGRTCAVGVLISDGNYSGVLEGCGIDSLNVQQAIAASGVDLAVPEMWRLLDRLQTIHDITKPEKWRESLRSLAQNFGLGAGKLGK